jgi:hypothetical protein
VGPAPEKEFYLGKGMGPKLMTDEEWKEHQQKMRTLDPTARGVEMPGMPAAGAKPGGRPVR